MQRIVPAGLIPTSFQVSTLSNSTAVAVNSTVRAVSNVLLISVETNNARFRCDSTAPTLTTGVLMLATNSPYLFEGYTGSANWKFQRSTGSCKLSIQGFRQGAAR
jgi:hypothetical protein